MELSILGRVILAALMTGVVGASGLFAYPTPVDFDGRLQRWNISIEDEPITYEVKVDGNVDDYMEVVGEAAEKWNEVESSYFRYAAHDDARTKAQVTVNFLRDISSNSYSSGFALFDEFDGEHVRHCSIEIRVGQGKPTISLAKTVLHEMGHCLGLGHSLVPQSIMSYELDHNSFALDLDDVVAVSRLYPADGSEPRLPLGCAIASGARDGKSPGAWILLLPILGIFLIGGRRPSDDSASEGHCLNR